MKIMLVVFGLNVHTGSFIREELDVSKFRISCEALIYEQIVDLRQDHTLEELKKARMTVYCKRSKTSPAS